MGSFFKKAAAMSAAVLFTCATMGAVVSAASYTPVGILGQANYTAYVTNVVTADSMQYPSGVALDAVRHRLFVADDFNSRVLVYALDADNNIASKTAINVLGQVDFVSNSSGLTRSTMGNPWGLTYDSVNNRLFVVDIGSNRILVYDFASGITNGMNASFVLGQTNFTSNAVGIDGSHFEPQDVTYDIDNDYLYVADGTNGRVLVFDVSPGTIANGMNAIHVLGQADFTSTGQQTTQDGLSFPDALAFNTRTNQLFVGDAGNSRITIFEVGSGIADGMNASFVLGAADFTTNGSGARTISTFSPRHGLGVDSLRNILYVPDNNNSRVLVFDLSRGIADGMDANMVIGEPDFTTNNPNCGTSNDQLTLCDPEGGVAIDEANNRVYIPDSFGYRVLQYDFVQMSSPSTLASGMAGAPYSQTMTTRNHQGTVSYSIIAGALPAGLSLDTATGVISGTPTTPGTYTFEIALTDVLGANGYFYNDPPVTITIAAASGGAATVGAPNTGIRTQSATLAWMLTMNSVGILMAHGLYAKKRRA